MGCINLAPLLVIGICSLLSCKKDVHPSSPQMNEEKSLGEANARKATYPSYNTNPSSRRQLIIGQHL